MQTCIRYHRDACTTIPLRPSIKKIISELRKLYPELEKEYHVCEIGLFGSILRGEETQSSDIDILVSFLEIPDLFSFIRL